MKKIALLGSTGSIGTQTLDVIRQTECAKVVALTAFSSIDLLESQIIEFEPLVAVMGNEHNARELSKRIKAKNIKTEILSGMDGLLAVAALDEADVLFNSLVGNVGLEPTLVAIENKKDIALANKETLVSAGELIMKKICESAVNIYPVDSEHSAIFQCLQGNEENEINKIYLTASGGPFRKKSYEELKKVTLGQALQHPNWNMGAKITIDSSTMMNKGLEVIEAKWLFDVPVSKIEVAVHHQSIVHSMVEFCDGSIIAQLGETDMRVPIQYALTYPKRIPNSFPKLNLFDKNTLTFERPNLKLFRCLKLAFDAIDTGGTMPAVMNAANEIAVSSFLKEEIAFLDIASIIEQTMLAYNVKKDYTIEDVFEADRWAREYAREYVGV